MEALDTNILVRLATRDDAGQLRKAERLMRENFSPQRPAWLSVIVVTEFAWVLDRTFRYPRVKIAESIRSMLDTSVFQAEDHELIAEALNLYTDSTADFSDCLILARNQARTISPTHTLDRKASKLEGYRLL